MAFYKHTDNSAFKVGEKVFAREFLETKDGIFTAGTTLTVTDVKAVRNDNISTPYENFMNVYALKDDEGNTVTNVRENKLRLDTEENRKKFKNQGKRETATVVLAFVSVGIIVISMLSVCVFYLFFK